MPSCYKKKKAECTAPDCEWIVGKGCKPGTRNRPDNTTEHEISKDALVEHASCKQKLAKATLRIEGFEAYVALLQKKIKTFAEQNKVQKDEITKYADKIKVDEKYMARLHKDINKYVDDIKKHKDKIALLRAAIRMQVARYYEGQEEVRLIKEDNYKMIKKAVALEDDIKLITSKLKKRVKSNEDLKRALKSPSSVYMDPKTKNS